MAVWSVPKLGTEMLEIWDYFRQSRDRFTDCYWSICIVLVVVGPEMTMNFGSKEVEPRLRSGLSTDSPRTVFETLKNSPGLLSWTKNVHVLFA